MSKATEQPALKVGVFGGSGYVGLELVRLLLQHPRATLTLVTSREHAGKPVSTLHQSLDGLCALQFSEPPSVEASPQVLDTFFADLDVLFFAVPHAQSAPVIGPLSNTQRFQAGRLRIIDLGADFRLSALQFSQFYKQPHPCPELLSEAVYGAPEICRAQIETARLVANPGCFANCITLGLLPLVDHLHRIGGVPVAAKVSAITGSTGSGVSPTPKTHHPARNESLSAYEVLTHRHGPEIEHALSHVSSSPVHINLVPHSGNFSRGIYATSFVTLSDATLDAATIYQEFCSAEYFLRYRSSPPRVVDVRGSNFCDITVRQQGPELVVISTIDNLVKGAAGNALQNMNIMYGFEEASGLRSAPLSP